MVWGRFKSVRIVKRVYQGVGVFKGKRIGATGYP